MKKKQFLIESKREKAIIESFAKIFNKIKRLHENEVPSMDIKTLEKKAFEFANSPEMGTFVDKILANAKPEKIGQLKRALLSVSEGITNENDFSSFLKFVDKAQSNLHEDNSVSDLQKSVGKAITEFGVINIMSMGMLPALVTMGLDYFGGIDLITPMNAATGGAFVPLSVIAGLIGGALLWRLGKSISGEKVDDNTPLFEGFLGDVVKKLKRLFTGEKMEKVRDADGYSYFKDEDGKVWIGVQRMDLRYEPGYQKSWVSIYDIKDENKIKLAISNAKAQNKEYMSTKEDRFSGDDGGFVNYEGDYYPEPIKVVNSETF